MNKLILSALVLISLSAKAREESRAEAVRDYKNHVLSMSGVTIAKGCVELQLVSIRFRYSIVTRLDKHHYELVGLVAEDDGIIFHGFLETTKAEFQNTGMPRGIKVRYLGTKKIHAANGFEVEFDGWKECEK